MVSASTIYNISSGLSKSAVAVIRVSGPQTYKVLKTIVGKKYEPKARHAHLRKLYHPESGEIIDKGLVLWFPGPASFTGEDSCEFQVHGSLAVVAAMLDALGKVPGLRVATPGEFTKRAFFGGKLDLTEVEGLADLIHAETEAQRKQALLQSTGALSRLYDNWRKRLIRCVANLEALIDFGEEEHIDSDDIVVQLSKELHLIISEINTHLNDQRKGEMLRSGVRTAIIGAPNVGKSSFLNLICQRNVSIVTNIAGTTRDIIEKTQNFGGYPVVFSDTAGLRKNTEDIVEKEGILKTKECVLNADLILLLIDAEDLLKKNVFTDVALRNYLQQYIQSMDINTKIMLGKKLQIVVNKIDLLPINVLDKLKKLNDGVLYISCKELINLQPLLESLQFMLKEICGLPTAENPFITQTRYRQQLEDCIKHINTFLREYSPDIYPDIAISAQKLRYSIKCIERITGHISTDDVLDIVFKDFCVGK